MTTHFIFLRPRYFDLINNEPLDPTAPAFGLLHNQVKAPLIILKDTQYYCKRAIKRYQLYHVSIYVIPLKNMNVKERY